MKSKSSLLLLLCLILSSTATGFAAEKARTEPLVIQEQGSLAVGGTVITMPGVFDPKNPVKPEGQTLHGDHAYAFYQIPVNPRKLPLVFLHEAFCQQFFIH